MSLNRATAHFSRPGGAPEPASESGDPTFATSIFDFGGIQIPRRGRK
jgi:hypothetical protein